MQSLTANRLRDGAVVYRRADGEWTRLIDHAAVYSEDAHTALEAANADVAAAIVVGLELIDVTVTDKGPQPVSLREKIRSYGPTV